jgi:acyl-CoA synthetase (NDP forming)
VHKHSQADTPQTARASPSTTTGNTRLIGPRLTGIYGTAVGVALGEVNPPGEPGQRHLEGSGALGLSRFPA